MSSVCFCSSMSPANVSRSNDGAIGAMLTAVFAIDAVSDVAGVRFSSLKFAVE